MVIGIVMLTKSTQKTLRVSDEKANQITNPAGFLQSHLTTTYTLKRDLMKGSINLNCMKK